ncbi:hypothetical protein A9Q96_14730 [Rhodobacterales bacterium 52_120_T64]|nr:hypothetical protein A9Q96_14730 [Rhodobacterales bacterium 52_120_T64]
MKRHFQSSISAVALSALVMTGVTATVSITASPALSKSDNANSNSNNDNRNDNSNRGNNGRGSVASSLGALNAAHANANAVENASENSRVGMIPLYRAAVTAWAEADAALEWFRVNCEEPTDLEIINDCTTTLGIAPGELGYAAAYDDHLLTMTSSLEDLDTLADQALTLAANKSTDEEVLAALWDLLLVAD